MINILSKSPSINRRREIMGLFKTIKRIYTEDKARYENSMYYLLKELKYTPVLLFKDHSDDIGDVYIFINRHSLIYNSSYMITIYYGEHSFSQKFLETDSCLNDKKWMLNYCKAALKYCKFRVKEYHDNKIDPSYIDKAYDIKNIEPLLKGEK